MKCRICGNEVNNMPYKIREMMFGTRALHDYFKCSACGCLQIRDIPGDLSSFYPSNYYSKQHMADENYKNPLRNFLKKQRDLYMVDGRPGLGALLYALKPSEDIEFLRRLKLNRDSRIIDLGCGNGERLYALRNMGFKNLLGVDPFIERDIVYANGLKVLKKTIAEISGEWDVIMLHHSLEHVSGQETTLRAVRALLAKEGRCLVRVPIVDSFAWEHYGVNWIQLDAPRHLYIYSMKSLEILFRNAGMKETEAWFDSGEFQFWGSEQYIKGIPLFSETSYAVNPAKSIFSRKQIKEFAEKAAALNREKRGDHASFLLKREG